MGTKKQITAGQHDFAAIPRAEIQRSTFNRNCGVKTTFDSGELIPIFMDEALPGDTMNLHMTTFARVATLLFPIMDNVYIDTFFFAVPIRLIWDNWEKFNGAQDNPGDSTDFLIPTMDSGLGYASNSLSDYLGIPIGIDGMEHSSLWHRSYALIWNEWFRDQNLQDSITVDKDDGPDDPADYVVMKRGKRHDYFTSCLPFPQKGDSVLIPLGDTAPVDIPSMVIIGDGATPVWQTTGDGTQTATLRQTDVGFTNSTEWSQDLNAGESVVWASPHLLGSSTTGTADLSMAGAATVNELRESIQVQRILERDARGGTRYTEIILAHFGISSPDERLMRPEFLGGGTVPVLTTPVASTFNLPENDEFLGDLGSYGVAQGGSVGFVKSFVEHCIIIGMVASRADINYQQGLARQFSRSTRFDFYLPALAHLGEQSVLNKEIMAQDAAAGTNEDVFGFQERFAEYRYKPSIVTGLFRSAAVGTLDSWHLAQDFATLPVLDDTFIQENPPMARVLAVPIAPHFLFDAFFAFKHARPLPTYSVPGLIDHF